MTKGGEGRQRVRGAFTPQSAAGGIGPCLSTGEPGVAAASNVPHSRRPALPRSNISSWLQPMI
jgi:hypothetical protein